ncbi:pyridoxal phosphate-dependent class II aminotransferase [Psychromonas sp. RZ22]|uniref:threonine-phosphate decarboxylase n=1 Tax=Psychromonas algarum TaxID=2555643 RepID=UPI0010686615|nr:threonine-phosphate decarboxylase [Psychromonas sp. RZ22]TEW56520.1 pyridoxal phosphate-dependent class II aminotransferase [Psychromonas sp. RZ22]
MAILHGGQLKRVAEQYQIPENKWLDLSTGIAPFSYPIPHISSQVWQDLPHISQDLINVAKQYYQAEYCWPVAGSQQLIEKLPSLWNDKINADNCKLAKHVYLPKVGYKEHQQAWDNAGYQLHFYQQSLPTDIEKNSVVVVINPNNPLADIFSIEQLSRLQLYCQQQQALLIIDEAFADIFEAEFSFVRQLNNSKVVEEDNTLVLRSFGKFFGLAGLRIGFVCCNKKWCELIKQSIGPWAINGPALYIAELALRDTLWQKEQKIKLKKQSQALQVLLKEHFHYQSIKANSLFITMFIDNAPSIYKQLCEQAIYVRLTDENDSLRFAIADQFQLQQLAVALSKIK